MELIDSDDSETWLLNANAGLLAIYNQTGNRSPLRINGNNTITDILYLVSDEARFSTVVTVDSIKEYSSGHGVDIEAINIEHDTIEFNDSNTEIWEDGSSNLSFKDANAGTYTLTQLAASAPDSSG